MRSRNRVVGLAAIALAGTAIPALGQSTAAPSATPPPATGLNCEEHEVWAHGDAAAVAGRLPSKYTAYMDHGQPLIFARAERCEHLQAGGRTDAVTLADYGIVINSPDGYGCSSGLPQIGVENGNAPPICNWYTLAFVTDDQRVVDLLGQGTPDVPVSYVPGLRYRMSTPDSQGTSVFHFAAPAPSPSTFSIDDTSSFRPGTIALRGSYYFPDSRQGTARLLVSTDDLTGGHADTTLRAAAGSELAKIMGATERQSVEPYNEFGVIRVGHGVLRKQLLGPALPGETLDSFSGSCSLQGDVTFNPPATDAQQATAFNYDSRGTCSGTLDGRAISAAPVTLHQSGHADASCLEAMTTGPGTGTVTFPDGTQLPYTLDFTSKLTELDGNAYGTRSGIATGHGSFVTQRTSPDLTAQCAGGGLAKAPMDMSLQTNSPLVSVRGAPAAEPEPATTRARSGRRLQLSVRPAKTWADKRTRFRFRVRAGREPASGAVLRFAGHRARVHNGRAAMVARLRHPGRFAARASKPGFDPARVVVVVRGR